MVRFAIAGLICFIMFSTAAPAAAIEYGGFGGRPANPKPDNPRTQSIFIYELDKGQSTEDAIMVVNNTPSTKTLLVYPTDTSSDADGEFSCKQFLEEKTDVGSWISMETQEVTLAPNTNQVIPFKVTVPDNALPGENNGCIAVQEKKEGDASAGLHISTRTAIRLIVTVPGRVPSKFPREGRLFPAS